MVDNRWTPTPSAAPAHRRMPWRNSPAFPAHPAGWFHSTLPADPRRLSARRAGLDPRGETRRLQADRSQGCGPSAFVVPPRNRLHRQDAENRRGGPQFTCEQRADRRRGGGVAPGGHCDFVALRTKAGGEQASFVAFDLLSLECHDLRQQALTDRREALEQLVAGVDSIQFSKAQQADGATVFAYACKLGLEGIVSKRVLSRYRSGASRNWLKCLNPKFERR